MRISDWSSDVCSSDLPEAAEMLARRRRSGVPDPVGRKVAAKSRGDTVARDLVVDIQGIAVERRDLRLARRARGCGFGIDDPLDRRTHALANPGIEGPSVELDAGPDGSEVFLGAGLQYHPRKDRSNGGP